MNSPRAFRCRQRRLTDGAAAGQINMASPDFQRLIEGIGGKPEVDLPRASREATSRGAK